ncbi:alpha/beta hydrolase family protein [Xanthomonas bonasiae]|uniref:alpha/beta hydrolase family protein n=1 Tax=Xanthomonas bonasiae TaxID=2810351 RepID=UPI001785658B|nr:alpha/beta fold hydrolase [Xanthomonas surreyensis]MBD7921630.1 S9 family peptidase [Xanthomonas surreyensis]
MEKHVVAAGGRVGRSLAWLLLLALCTLALPAWARMQEVKPGQTPQLAPDEGLVLVAVDTDVDLYGVELNKDGKIFGAGTMSQLKPGISYRLYIAPVGNYAWRKISLLPGFSYNMRDSDEFRFRIQPGRITYPGDLLFRPKSLFNFDLGMVNRSLAAMDWLQQTHPAVWTHYELGYSGHYPDPFPQFYRQALAQHPNATPAAKVALRAPPPPAAMPIAPATVFRGGLVNALELNPRGDLLALQLHERKDEWRIELLDLASNQQRLLATSVEPIKQLLWAGNDALLFTVRVPHGQDVVRGMRVDVGADGKRKWSALTLPDGGYIVDALPQAPNTVLYATTLRNGDNAVQLMDVSSQAAIDRWRPRFQERLNIGLERDVGWLTDGNGRLRLAVVRRDDDYVLLYRDGMGATYRDVMRLSDLRDFQPVGLSFDAGEIYAVTDEGRGQRDLVAYDVAARKIVRTLFSQPGVDVVDLIQGPRRTPIGVTYYESGRLVSHYFESTDERLGRALSAALPGRNVQIAARNADGRQMILWADAADQPPQLYHLDLDKRAATPIAEDMPWLQGLRFAPSEVLKFKGRDGLPLEAFLTLPPGGERKPLVVFPHGGPIGVADSLGFDPDTQFLASLGYAVLRVNFRGSDGYGRAFREAGRDGFGMLIEDDIDAAIEQALARYPLDAQRMCVLGASYGGYSALVMAMRWPARFRCVASIAGVADRILIYTASDGARDADSRADLERLLGNPNTQLEQMTRTSPLYRYEAIKVPVLLAHGLEDRRVDYEHTRRMLRMLEMAGNPPVGLTFAGEGHGFADVDHRAALWSGVAGFLQAHLSADAPPQKAATP